MRLPAAVLALLIAWPALALEDPPQITWEWFKAAETYRNYKLKGKDDLRISAHYFRLAAEKGNAAAAYKLGEVYENGIGVAKDPAHALHWYLRSAAQGDKYAELRVGWFYHKGIAVPADPAVAAKWYRMSARKNNIWAYHMLAFMLADGEGVDKDVELARDYFERSLPETKDQWAKWKLAHLLKASDPYRARLLLQEAAAAGNTLASEDLKQF